MTMSSFRPSLGSHLRQNSAAEVFVTFLKLGIASFGGPIAHLGYFHRELVTRRRWVDEEQYAQLLALCQFLPGPASSQLGFALGLIRAGWRGALAAFVAFTLPSALLLVLFASAADHLAGAYGQALLHALKLVAVAVVADGMRRMAMQLTPDAPRMLIGLAAALTMLGSGGGGLMQLGVVAAGALAGLWASPSTDAGHGGTFALPYGSRAGAMLLTTFVVLLAVAFAIAVIDSNPVASVVSAFYRAGALVFGGGHVVLPLLQEAVVAPGWISTDEFLTGYGAAQAVPGPMFTLAAFLGARLDIIDAQLGAAVCLLAIFTPGFLLVSGALPFWRRIGSHPRAARAVAGVNAAVVGLLAAALYDPVWTSAVQTTADVAIAFVGFALLTSTRASTLLVIAWCMGANMTIVLLDRSV